MEWWRYYDSRWHGQNRGLGFGHRHPFDHWLVFDLDGITYRHVGGYDTQFPFVEQDGARVARGGYTLERVDSESYRVHRHGEPSYEFRIVGGREGKLVALHRGQHSLMLQYDESDRLSHVLAPDDRALLVGWDEERIVEVTYRDSEGKKKSFVRYRYQDGYLVEGRDAYDQRFTFRYHRDGRMAQRTDRRGYSFYWEYDDEGRCIRNHGDGGLLSVELRYIPLAYRTEVLDANGGEWVYEYLPNGLVTFITDPYGGTRYYQIDDEGRLLAEYDERGAKTEYRFDHAGAPVAKITPDGDVISLPEEPDAPAPREHRVPSTPIEWELGDLWDLDFTLPDSFELPSYLPPEVRSLLRTSEDERRGGIRNVTDEQGLLVLEELEDGRRRTYGYNENGGLRHVVDFDGGRWSLEHASWNHVVKEVDPLGNETLYEYSQTEKVTAVVDPAGVRTDYRYDLKDRLVEVRRGGLTRESYEYDAAGNLVEKRDANGDVLLSMEYDRYGHLLRRVLASGDEHTFAYDENGRCTMARTLRHQCTFAHDSAGRRIADKRDGVGVQHRYEGARLVATTLLDRFRIQYRHEDGMVIVDPTGAEHRIRDHGRGIFTRECSNGIRETVQFHPRGGQVLCKAVWTGSEAAWTRVYRYSGEGNLIEVHDSQRGTTRYEHDAAHRLRTVEHPGGRIDSYEYNRAGALFRSPTLDGTVGDLNNLRYANSQSLEYDARHHLSERIGPSGTTVYERDSRDQLLVAYWKGTDGRTWGWDAEYDPFGRRIRKSPHYRKHSYYYWDGDRLAAEIMREGRVRVYVYPDGFAMVPMLFVDYESIDSDAASGARYLVFADQRGCPERIVDDTKRIVWLARIDPHGYTHVEEGGSFHQPFRFPGHFADGETGLHYNRFRYYSPELGQYLESDPLGIAGQLPVYSYALRPLTSVDIDGLCPLGALVRRWLSRLLGRDAERPRPPGGGADNASTAPNPNRPARPATAQPETPQERRERLQRQIDERRRENLRREALDEAIRRANADGRRDRLNPDDRAFVDASPENARLAIDPEGSGGYRVNEARAAQAAERQGLIDAPVRRALGRADGQESGGDFVDGSRTVWDHKDASMGPEHIATTANRGENVLVDARGMGEGQARTLASDVNSRLDDGRTVESSPADRPAVPPPSGTAGRVIIVRH